jgi:ABC-type Fe3+/spermidine/putrescine transport system ATPase subunit
MRPVAFREVAKSFGPVRALRPTTLDIAAGEFLTLLGPSGSGKTTLLNLAAGYLTPDEGRIRIDGRDITELPARRRNIGMVFQSYALFPHLSVFENVAYGLRARGRKGGEIRRAVEEALAMVQLAGFGKRAIKQLSGGQQQRVALARALVIEPDVLLFDEPLGALDRQLRKHVQLEIRRLHQRHGRTTIYVTHDQEEALVMSDRIAVMREGRIEQIGSGRDLYERPANSFVAGFLGESNLVEGRVTRLSGGCAELAVPALGTTIRGVAAPGLAEGRPAAALIRPEGVRIGAGEAPGLPARIVETVYLGEIMSVRLLLADETEIWCRRLGNLGEAQVGAATLGWSAEEVRILPIHSNEENEGG